MTRGDRMMENTCHASGRELSRLRAIPQAKIVWDLVVPGVRSFGGAPEVAFFSTYEWQSQNIVHPIPIYASEEPELCNTRAREDASRVLHG